MITGKQALVKFGDPVKEFNLILWDVPSNLEIGVIPKKIYCNKVMVEPLTKAVTNLIHSGCVSELISWDGCFNIRPKHSADSPSLHSWALAVDLNAGRNRYGMKPTLSPQFVKCFTDACFDWGGYWSTPDGMHFQISKI